MKKASDKKWTKSVMRSVDQVALDNAERWWKSIPADDKQKVLLLVQHGEPGAARGVLQSRHGLGPTASRSVVTHACKMLAKAEQGSKVDSGALAHAAALWNRFGDVFKGEILDALRAGDCRRAGGVLKRNLYTGIVARAIMIHACSVLAHELEDDDSEASGYSQTDWENLSEVERRAVDVLLGSDVPALAFEIPPWGAHDERTTDAVNWRMRFLTSIKTLVLNRRETATVLAALRHRQCGLLKPPMLGEWDDIATCGGDFAPMSADEIAGLCIKINGG